MRGQCNSNLIAEHMYAQVDEDGHRFLLPAEIIVYLCNPNTAVKEKYSYLSNKTDQKVRIYTTEG